MTQFTVPIRTGQGLNDRLGWRAKAAIAKKERQAVGLLFPWWAKKDLTRPFAVKLTRVSPGTRPMDDDNLPGALKAVRDQVADELGVDDGRMDLIRFSYFQARGKWGVVVEIEEVAPGLDQKQNVIPARSFP